MCLESHLTGQGGVLGHTRPVAERKQSVWPWKWQGVELLRETAAGDRLAGTQAIPKSCRERPKGTYGLWLCNGPGHVGFQLQSRLLAVLFGLRMKAEDRDVATGKVWMPWKCA